MPGVTGKCKKLILIRHGSSHANEYMDRDGNRWGDNTFADDASLVDSELSTKGKDQATLLCKELLSDNPHQSAHQILKESLDSFLKDIRLSENGYSSGGVLLVTSPLTRAIETFSKGILPYLNNESGRKKCLDCGILKEGTLKSALAQPLATERVYTASDTGRIASTLHEEFQFVDFNSIIQKDASQPWWYTHAEELEGPFVEWRPNDGQQFYAVPGEPLDRFHQRMVKLYQWIESREEDVIVMVTHWAVIRFFTGQEDVENCGVRVVDFDRVRLKEDIVSLCMKQ